MWDAQRSICWFGASTNGKKETESKESTRSFVDRDIVEAPLKQYISHVHIKFKDG
jgi:hypothetical protein